MKAVKLFWSRRVLGMSWGDPLPRPIRGVTCSRFRVRASLAPTSLQKNPAMRKAFSEYMVASLLFLSYCSSSTCSQLLGFLEASKHSREKGHLVTSTRTTSPSAYLSIVARRRSTFLPRFPQSWRVATFIYHGGWVVSEACSRGASERVWSQPPEFAPNFCTPSSRS